MVLTFLLSETELTEAVVSKSEKAPFEGEEERVVQASRKSGFPPVAGFAFDYGW